MNHTTTPTTRRLLQGSTLALVFAALLLAAACENAEEAAHWGQAATTERASDGPVELTVTVDKTRVHVAEPLRLTIDVLAEPGLAITLPTLGKTCNAFTVSNVTQTHDLPAPNGTKRLWTLQADLDTLDAAKKTLTLPDFKIAYRDTRLTPAKQGTLAVKPITIEILSALTAADRDPTKFRDIKGTVDLPRDSTRPESSWPTLFAIAGGAMLILGLAGWVVYRKRRTPQARALRELAQLESQNLLAAGELERFYVRITAIVRRYVERRFAIHAPQQTTREFLDALRQRDELLVSENGDAQETLHAFLEAADQVKFACLTPQQSASNQALSRAREFVTAHTPQRAAGKPTHTDTTDEGRVAA